MRRKLFCKRAFTESFFNAMLGYINRSIEGDLHEEF